MKRSLLALLTLLIFTSGWLHAAETESNDTRNTANKLLLNNSNTGAIGTATDVDWWKVSTTSDGKLDITLIVSNGLYCYYQLYDFDGTTLLKSSYTNGTATFSQDGLAPGTYYIYIYAFTAGQLPAYTISNFLNVASLANEPEPNALYTQANVLAPTGSSTGHIGYYYNGVYDVSDWWSITTTGNGKINLQLSVVNGQYIYFVLYDHDGTTVLKSSYTNGIVSYDQDGLSAGTYYVNVYPFSAGGFAPYTLTSTFTAPVAGNDIEPNGLFTQANTLPLNGSATGQVGYYYNLVRDTTDWFKITTTGNGALNLNLAVENAQYIYYQLYDGDGSTILDGSHYTNGTANYTKDGLAAGTYYVKIFAFTSSGFAPYTLTSTFTAPPVANDAEPNNSKSQAKNLPLNNVKTGQVGYYYNGVTDVEDWFKVTTTGDGALKLTIISQNGQYVYYQLFDNDGVTSLQNAYTNGNQSYIKDGLAAGTYYVKIYPFYTGGFIAYTISDTLIAAPVANDAEPNNGKSEALDFAVGSTVTGHTNYYYDLVTDVEDWYKIVTPKDGQINLTITSENGQYVYLQLYDNDGTTLLKSNYTNGTLTHNTDGLAAGTYYVKVFAYYSNGFIPYTLSNSLTEYANANDGINNEIAKKAATLPANFGNTGHVGFRSNGGAIDLKDWWKINYTGSGDLTVSLTWEPMFCCGNPLVYLIVYSDTALAPIFNTYSSAGSLTANFTGLPKQYYYV
ncbi:MAG: T9SS type A sorting domain-containing protein, partial [Chitinophagales bacterium]